MLKPSQSPRDYVALLPVLLGVFLTQTLSATPAFAVKEYVPGITFGQPCVAGEVPCGGGRFKEPVGLAVNDSTGLIEGAGDVYVADKGDNRVERFSAAGVFEAQFNGSGAPKPLSAPEYVAVDNSTTGLDSALGNVYVTDNGHHAVDEFTAAGTYVGQLTGTCPSENESQAAGKCVPSGVAVTPFAELLGIAVGAAGEVWVHDNTGNFDEFTNAGVYTTTFQKSAEQPGGIALDSEGNVYANAHKAREGRKYSPTGSFVAEFAGPGVTGLAVASLTNDVLVDKGSGLELYGPIVEEESGRQEPIQLFATGLADSHGVAVNSTSATQTVYASERTADDVRAFNYLPFPTVTAPSASEVSNTVEMLGGTVEPEGEAITECRFEYGLVKAEPGHYEHSVACKQKPEDITGTSVPVSAKVEGLTPGATYHYRLDVSNKNGTGNSPDATFTLFPVVGGESFSGVGSSSAVLHAAVEPGGVPTSYFFDYGTSTQYGSRTPSESAGASSDTVAVSAPLEGLSPDTTYHFRVVATSADGTERGADASFSTFALAIAGLPDGRGYELVSPLENGYAEVVSGTRAAADGSAVAYLGQAPEQGGNGNNTGPNETGLSGGASNQYLASRSPTGWTATDIQPTGLTSVSYRAFSDDFSLALLTSSEPLVSGAPAENALYSRQSATGGFDLLGPGLSYAASTPDGSHVLLQKGHELYELAGGALSPVNVLSGGGLAANASFGGPSIGGPLHPEPDLSHVISGDGARVFWSEEEPLEKRPLRLFVSEGVGGPGERTVQLDAAAPGCVPCTSGGGGGLFWTASTDGSKVFFTDENQLTANATAGQPDLYEYDLTAGILTDLTPATTNPAEHANVVGVLGAGSDGSYVYFAAAGSLAGTGATPQTCAPAAESGEPPNNKCNVYVLHDGEAPRLVATVTAQDGEAKISNFIHGGDWVRVVGHSSFVSEDGRVLVFKSIEHLTGFDSLGDQEIYSYQYGVGLTCVSCNPSGAPTIHGKPYEVDVELPNNNAVFVASRDLSADGGRVFFETAEALVPQDGNGKTDVYEWERDGTGSCTRAAGCLYLLSGGTSSHNSHFVDASESGDDVFFITDAELVPADRGEYTQLYDARVGATEALAGTACTGTGCQGVPPAPPIFATPPSATITGVDDLAPLPAAGAKKATKKKTVKCAKGKKLARGKCVKARKKAKAKKSAHINRRAPR
jgi:sugar lactone lactonase YvrE